MSTTTTTTTTRDRGDRYGPIEWARLFFLIQELVTKLKVGQTAGLYNGQNDPLFGEVVYRRNWQQ